MMNKMVVVRVIVFLLAWLNQTLVAKGLSPLPILGEDVVAAIVTFIVSAWALATDNKPKNKDGSNMKLKKNKKDNKSN